jgi:hypothetical protein
MKRRCEKWLHKVVTSDRLSDKDVAALIKIYEYLDPAWPVSGSRKLLPPGGS